MNNSFSLKRIGLLYKQYYFLNENRLLLVLIATCGLISGYHFLIHLFNYRFLADRNFAYNYHTTSFVIAMVGGSLLWCGSAFPAFRSSQKRFSYLINPVTTTERFMFEFINRIVIFIVAFPLIYWISTNLVTSIFHYYNPDYENYLFNYSELLPQKTTNSAISLILTSGLLFVTILYTGATYFQKLPQVKTIITTGFVWLIIYGYSYLAVEVLNLEPFLPVTDRKIFMLNVRDLQIAVIIANITLLIISYLKVKEKEV
jgi:hypothetical protein